MDFRNLLVFALTVVIGAESSWSLPLLALIGLVVSLVWFWPFVRQHRAYIWANIALAVLSVALLDGGWVQNIVALTMPFGASLFWYRARYYRPARKEQTV